MQTMPQAALSFKISDVKINNTQPDKSHQILSL